MTRETETEAMLHAVRECQAWPRAPLPAGTAIAKEMQPLADQLATVTAARREAGQRIEVLSAQKRRAERQNVTATGQPSGPAPSPTRSTSTRWTRTSRRSS